MRSIFRQIASHFSRRHHGRLSFSAGTRSAGAVAGVAWSLLLLTSGCGGVEAVPVSGTVMVDGVPLEGVALNFTPIAAEGAEGPGSSGVTDAQGHFSLKTIGARRARGAVVGKHRVILSERVITGPDSDPYEPGISPEEAEARLQKVSLRYKLPPSARDGTLTFDVPPGGTSDANFAW